jgi:hypothetical protein
MYDYQRSGYGAAEGHCPHLGLFIVDLDLFLFDNQAHLDDLGTAGD